MSAKFQNDTVYLFGGFTNLQSSKIHSEIVCHILACKLRHFLLKHITVTKTSLPADNKDYSRW